MESRVLLELKALREGAWKMGEFTAFFPKTNHAGHTGVAGLVEGHALKAHPDLQAMLINVQQYKPSWAGWRSRLLRLKNWTSPAATPENRNSWTTWWTWTTCTAPSLPWARWVCHQRHALFWARRCMCNLTADPKKGTPRAGLLSWMHGW